jgi:hypothetical protein
MRVHTAGIAVAAVTLFVAGCGGGSPAPIAAQASFSAAAFKYSSCMREHGLSSFPDPSMTDHDGQQVAYLTATIPVHPSAAFKSAQSACRGILPPPINASPTELAQQRQARDQHLLAFADCLRNHGVPDFPDPTSQGQLTLEMVNSAGVDVHAPTVLRAAKICLPTTDGAITRTDVQRALDDTQ